MQIDHKEDNLTSSAQSTQDNLFKVNKKTPLEQSMKYVQSYQ